MRVEDRWLRGHPETVLTISVRAALRLEVVIGRAISAGVLGVLALLARGSLRRSRPTPLIAD